MSKRPNILLITSDQQHFSTLGVTNPRIQTPALDRLCAEGTRFDRAYCPNPTCSPTRASMITGQYPSVHGCWSLGTKLPEEVPTVGQLLSEAGYATSLIGKAHFQPLATAPSQTSLECQPILRDLDFWRGFNGPWYGFDRVEVCRNHTDESHVGQHYAIWLEERGLTNWRDYFQPWPPDPNRVRREHHWDLPAELHYTAWTGERTNAAIERAHAAGEPFFLWSSYHDPHPSYLVSEPWASMYDPADMVPGELTPGEHDANPPLLQLTQQRGPDFGRWRGEYASHGLQCHLHDREALQRNMATYYGMVSFMDQQIGQTLATLDRLGLAEDTIVVFSTDHGHYLGHHGLIAKGPFHYEDGIRVPFIVRYPGRVPAGEVSQALQSLLDLPETFLGYAGLPRPGQMQGVDQRPAWEQGEAQRDHVICEFHHQPRSLNLRTYINERYKLTVYHDATYGELRDLAADPGEVVNLWDQPEAQGLKAELLLEMMQATMNSAPLALPRIATA